MLFLAWTDRQYRPTKDLDLLAYGDRTLNVIHNVFIEICKIENDDGLTFDVQNITAEEVREDQTYEGARIRVPVQLGNARISLQIDIGFGDAITPAAETIVFPGLLNFPSARLRAYPRSTVIAEKLECIFKLGPINSRLKDYFDMYVLARDFSFEGEILTKAVEATCARRGTPVPKELPSGLENEFGFDKNKQIMWTSFLQRSRIKNELLLPEILQMLQQFILPILQHITNKEDMTSRWNPGGPWQTGT